MCNAHPHIGIAAWFGVPSPFTERVRMIRDAGFTATTLWWEDRYPEARKMRHYAPPAVREAELDIDHIHAPYRGCNDLWSGNDGDRSTMIDRYAECIADCARHEVHTLVMHASTGTIPAEQFEYGRDAFKRLIERAEDAGVRIALENTRDAALIQKLLDAIESPAIGICYDIAHDTLHSDKPYEILVNIGERVFAAHINDHDGKRDRHWIPGDGVIDYQPLHDALPKSNVIPILELHARDKKTDIESFLRKAYVRAAPFVHAQA